MTTCLRLHPATLMLRHRQEVRQYRNLTRFGICYVNRWYIVYRCPECGRESKFRKQTKCIGG